LAGDLLPGWDGNRYALLIAGAALVGGGLAARTGASLIEESEQEPGRADRTSG
jgi:hypothetical protein